MKKFIKKTVSVLLIISAAAVLLCGCDNNEGQLNFRPYGDDLMAASYKDLTTVTALEIPDEKDGKAVTKVADYAVCNSESLTEITIGKNVSEIGTWAFTNNINLLEFKVSPENEYFCAVDGVLFTKDMKTLLFYPMGKSENEPSYTVPDTVETIRSKAFYKCGALKEIILPDGLLNIEEMALHKCTSIEDLDLPDGLQTIGKDCLFGCTGLTEITVPASITTIDEYAFFNCTNLKTVNMEGSEADMQLGEKWFPTNNGRDIDDLQINWN